MNVFGNGLVAMLSRGIAPVPGRVAECVEEMLRFDSALQLFERTATSDVRVGDVTVEEGQKIAALLGAANRDPAVFEDADVVRRRPGTPTRTWRSVPACTSASALRSHAWSSSSRWGCCGPGCRASTSSGSRRRAGPSCSVATPRSEWEPEVPTTPVGHTTPAGAHNTVRHRPSTTPAPERGPSMTERHDAVEVIVAKRDGRELSDSQIDWVVDAYTRGVVADEQMSALAMAILLNGMSRRGDLAAGPTAMIASGERMDFSSLSRPTARQALHRWCRRQDHPAAGAARGGVRRRRTPALRPRARPHRRHAGQARVDPRLARRPRATRS